MGQYAQYANVQNKAKICAQCNNAYDVTMGHYDVIIHDVIDCS